VAVNSAGEVVLDATSPDPRLTMLEMDPYDSARASTTLAVIAIDAPVDRRTLVRSASAAHAAIARAIRPSHTIIDGDAVFVVGLQSTIHVEAADVLALTVGVELAVERAIIDAVTS
jgi:L-aminopeptidase/D-esterase-like protein